MKSEFEQPQVLVDPAVSLAFLLDPTNPLALYDAQVIPLPIVVEIICRTLEILPEQLLEDRLNVFLSQFYTKFFLACSSKIINIASCSTYE